MKKIYIFFHYNNDKRKINHQSSNTKNRLTQIGLKSKIRDQIETSIIKIFRLVQRQEIDVNRYKITPFYKRRTCNRENVLFYVIHADIERP